MELLIGILIALHLVTASLAIAHLLLHYRRPAAAVAWLFALLALPFAGPVSYAMLAMPGGRRALRRRREAADIRGSRERRVRADYEGIDVDPAFGALMRTVRAFPLTKGNAVDVIADGDDALREQIEAIRSAEREVLVGTYVLKPGRVHDVLIDALADRAASGVLVRLLVDPIGSQNLPNEALAEVRRKGVEAATFLTPNPLKGRFQVNFRNHRKILCIDGGLAFTGGRNWADEYFPESGGEDAFRDTTVRLRGPVVAGMRRVFQEDWALATGDESVLDVREPGPERDVGDRIARVLSFGPDEPNSSVVDVLGGAFRAARESIFVATPYFVPGATLHHALRVAALGGVQIDLLIPRRCGKRSIDLTARYYLDGLLDAGARAFLREPPLLHAKAVIVDGVWSTFGSVNFDERSLHLNYELNVEVLGADFAAQLRAFFEPDLARAERLDGDAFAARGRWARVKEKAAALFEPLM